MVDAVLGKWRSDVTKTQGFEEFRDATGHADKWPSQPQTTTLEISRNGDEWTVTSETEGHPKHTTTVKEGGTTITKGFDGSDIEIRGSVQGDKWVAVIKAGENEIRSVIRIEDGELVQEQTLKGATLTTRFTRL